MLFRSNLFRGVVCFTLLIEGKTFSLNCYSYFISNTKYLMEYVENTIFFSSLNVRIIYVVEHKYKFNHTNPWAIPYNVFATVLINQSLHVSADKRSYINVISVMNTHDLSSLHTIYNSLTRVVEVDNRCENGMPYILPSNICRLQHIPINVTIPKRSLTNLRKMLT